MKFLYCLIFGFISSQSLVHAQSTDTQPPQREIHNQNLQELSSEDIQQTQRDFERKYEFVRGQQGTEFWRHKESGIVFIDNFEYDDESLEPNQNIRIFDEQEGKVKTISPTDPMYRRYSVLYGYFQSDKRGYDAVKIVEMERRQQQHQQATRGANSQNKNFFQKIAKKVRIIGGILASLGIASEVAEGSTSLNEIPARLADESTFSHPVTDSDTVKYRIDDLLEDLKTDIQKLDPKTKFSQERQRLNNELRSLYTDVQMDTALQNEEKVRYLRTIAQIQDLAQPPLRNFPQYRRDRRGSSRGTQGTQGSLDRESQEPQTHFVRPTRGIASVPVSESDSESTSLQCSCSCTKQEK